MPRTSAAAALQVADLPAELARLEAGIAGRLGVAVHEASSPLRFGHRSSERFPLCSTFKLLACGAVLTRVDAGREDLDRRIRFAAADVVAYSPVTGDRADGDGMTLAELCEAAMTRSDNTAGNLIVASLGGPTAVTAYARTLGDQSTRLDRIETELNEARPGDPRDTTTPDSMAGNLQALLFGRSLSQQSRDRLTSWLVANRTGDAKLRAGLPKLWKVGDKTGGGDWGTTNDIAVLWPPDRSPLMVCVYLTDCKASFDERNATIASVGQAVSAALGG